MKGLKKCPCGQRLPLHLFEVGLKHHTCSCRRVIEVKDSVVVETGVGQNPFQDFDDAVRENTKTYDDHVRKIVLGEEKK